MSIDPLISRGSVRLKECRYGPMLYPTTDRFVGGSLDRYGEFSEGEVALFRQMVKPGWTVLEAGANIGSHTVFLGQAVGREGTVLAFEPQRVLFQILCANVALGGLHNVYAYQSALGPEPGQILVPQIDYEQPGNFGGVGLGGAISGERVAVTTIDAHALPRCGFIKIDVEGMESAVIAGAQETISRCRPYLYVENDRREKSAKLIEQLLNLDYRLYWHLPPLFNRDNFFGNPENAFEGIVSVNVFGVPAERKVTLTQFREITTPDADWRVARESD
jgi:FkbM family methyltransferase